MALRTNISERQRRLGAELRKLREQAGMSADEAGKHIEMGRAHLSHVEGGRTAIPSDSLRQLCLAYGCTSEPYVAALIATSEASGKGWWTDYRRTMQPSALDLAELEATADSVRSYESLFVPGLLQVEEYTRSIFRASTWPSGPDASETAVRFRMQRQQVLAADTPPRLHAVIHEAALHMRFGGSAVMRKQLRHLIELADQPHVTLQILPFTAQGVSSLSTPFVITGSHGGHLKTVLMEHPGKSQYLHDPDSLARYQAHFDRLSAAALSPVDARAVPATCDSSRDSLGLIQHILYTL